jgi:hypothetical protein
MRDAKCWDAMRAKGVKYWDETVSTVVKSTAAPPNHPVGSSTVPG